MHRSQYLAGFRGKSYPTVPSDAERSQASHEGTLEELQVKFPEIEGVLWNDVKACSCGKPCAFTMTTCNACGKSLVEVPITKSENVFSAFLYGVKMAARGFPYKISLRRQTMDALVFDDMLALTPCHLNGISAKYYIPDWRFLLVQPKEGLKVLDLIEAELWAATLVFFRNSEWRKTIFKGDITEEELWGKVIKSFNFPPSQFQLHIQWLVPPLTPFQHYMAEIRNHFHEDRAFPIAYVRELLKLNDPYPVNMNTPITEITDHYDKKGINYKEHWNEFYQKALKDSMDLCNFDAGDFEYLVEGGKAHKMTVSDGAVVKGEVVEDVNLVDIQKLDCLALQNYGRPYEDGKPTGTYIKRPLAPNFLAGGYKKWHGVDEK